MFWGNKLPGVKEKHDITGRHLLSWRGLIHANKRISSQNNVDLLGPFSPLEQVCMLSLVNKGFTYKLKTNKSAGQ